MTSEGVERGGFQDEANLVDYFIDSLKLYPFKTKVVTENQVGSGKADIYLPHYDVVIEAKNEKRGLKGGIGQAIYYAEQLDAKPYVLIPDQLLHKEYMEVCKERDIGIIVMNAVRISPRVVNDIGGLEQFDLSEYERIADRFGFVLDPETEYIVGDGEKEKLSQAELWKYSGD